MRCRERTYSSHRRTDRDGILIPALRIHHTPRGDDRPGESSMIRMKNALLAVVTATLGACSSGYGGTTSPIPGDGHTIAATPSLTFGPSSLRVNAGTVVTFAFGSVAHNVFFDAQTGAPADIDGL